MFHAVHACFPGAFASLVVQDGEAAWLAGESGAITAAGCVVLAMAVWQRLPRGAPCHVHHRAGILPTSIQREARLFPMPRMQPRVRFARYLTHEAEAELRDWCR